MTVTLEVTVTLPCKYPALNLLLIVFKTYNNNLINKEESWPEICVILLIRSQKLVLTREEIRVILLIRGHIPHSPAFLLSLLPHS